MTQLETGTWSRRPAPVRTREGRWSRPALAVLLAGALSTAGAVVLVPASSADTLPKKVLQAVDVQLGADGSVTHVSSTDVRRDVLSDKGTPQTTQRVLDPTKVAGDLPVRVTVSYVHGDRAGTDLADLKGASGRVEVDVTVTNTTVHPEQFTVDTGGVSRTTYALVGTPLTVVASATLPSGSFASIVRPTPGTTGGRETNGVVARSGADTTVQWASLLAPPRLAASTTFRLVEDATQFRLPHLDLSVQPGFATDTSVTRLLDDAFGGDVVSVQQNTISLITQVDASLAMATNSLREVGTTLRTNATTVGAAASNQLTVTSEQVSSAADSLTSTLTSLQETVKDKVSSSTGAAIGGLQTAVTNLQTYVGTPTTTAAQDVPPHQSSLDAAPAPGCDVAAAASAVQPTLTGQLKQVSSQLLQLSTGSVACVGQLRTALAQTIGGTTTCLPGSTTLLCQLTGVHDQLTAATAQLQAQTTRVLGEFDAAGLDKVGSALGVALSAVTQVQAGAAALSGANALGGLSTTVAALRDPLADLVAATDPSSRASDSLAPSLTALHSTAVTQAAVVAGAGDTVAAQVQDLASTLCAAPVPAVPVVDPSYTAAYLAYQQKLRALVAGTACPAVSPSPTVSASPSPSALPVPDGFSAPLTARIDADEAAWQQVVSQTDLAHPAAGSPAAALTALHAQAQALSALLTAAQDALRNGSSGIGTQLTALSAAINALYDGSASPTCLSLPDPTTSLNALQNAVVALTCNQKGLATDLSAVIAGAAPTYAAVADAQLATVQTAQNAQGQADGQLLGLAAALSGQLRTAAQDVLDQGNAAATQQKRLLAAEAARTAHGLAASSQQALAQLSTVIQASNQQQAASSTTLTRQISKVSTDLGTGGDSKGLLGVVLNSAGLTSVQTGAVDEASATAADFSGVRGADVAQAELVRQQVQRSLTLVQTAPAFALTLPAGSTDQVVYTLHLAGV